MTPDNNISWYWVRRSECVVAHASDGGFSGGFGQGTEPFYDDCGNVFLYDRNLKAPAAPTPQWFEDNTVSAITAWSLPLVLGAMLSVATLEAFKITVQVSGVAARQSSRVHGLASPPLKPGSGLVSLDRSTFCTLLVATCADGDRIPPDMCVCVNAWKEWNRAGRQTCPRSSFGPRLVSRQV